MKTTSFTVFIIFTVALALFTLSCAPARFTQSRIAMDAPLNLIVYAPSAPDWQEIFAFAEKTAESFDHRIKDGPLERINRTGSGKLPEPAFSALKESLLIAEKSGGAFDPTVLDLMTLWDFEGKGRVPSPAEISAALRETGYRRVKTADPDRVAVSPGMKLDLGGIGEGAVVDALADYLRSQGCADFLVDASGEIVVNGTKPGKVPWRVAIRSPRLSGMPRTSPDYAPTLLGVLGAIELPAAGGQTAISTSGDYEKFFVKDGIVYAHIVDPRTGSPPSAVASVTVIAGTCADADALATTAFVLGWERGLSFLENWTGVEGLIVRENDGKLETETTSGFPKLIPVEEEGDDQRK
ncbi:MAG: FAD:protein FMN transferase [Spirochaetales bacterium]|nr:FAD:protein FMN transferase [Spirochaetales bacterium]